MLLLASLVLTIAVTFVTLLIAVAMISIRHIFTGEPFRGTCAQNNPMLKNQIGDCTVCGKKPEEDCKMPEVHTE